MRARYYNPEIKRFINQDVLIGTIADSPSMNRYAYVHGNPISLADPFGLSPQTNWGNFLGHMALSAASMLMFIPTPVTFAIGAAAAIANTAWYAAEGNYFGAICSGLVVFGGAGGLLGVSANAASFGGKACQVGLVLRTVSNVGFVAAGSYDIYQIYRENYQKYVVNGEDFSLADAGMDLLRGGLDVVMIGVGANGLRADGLIPSGSNPKSGSLNDLAARKWYLKQEAKIPKMIDNTQPLEQQARQAHMLRNQFRDQTRNAMKNRGAANKLNKERPNLTWEKTVEKYTDKGYYGDELWQQIIEASQRSDPNVNRLLGIK